jgi:hypothetical protein
MGLTDDRDDGPGGGRRRELAPIPVRVRRK